MPPTVDLEVAELALSRCEANDFEKFVSAFVAAVVGPDYVPLGGMHDGGADGFISSIDSVATKFSQASISADYRTKIRKTIKRLRDFGRTPRTLLYVTNQNVPEIDVEEETLTDELGSTIRIRHRSWILAQLNKNMQSVAAYQSYVAHYADFLKKIGASDLVSGHPNFADKTVCVFLAQEAERRAGNSSLLESVTDSLILWALEDTDPDSKKLMDRKEILDQILKYIPSAKKFIKGAFDARLEKLSGKDNPNGREVRWYKKEDKFCLPFEMRQIIQQENKEDELLRLRVRDQFKAIAAKDAEPDVADEVARVALDAIHRTFEKEGLELAAFLAGGGGEDIYSSIADQVDEALENSKATEMQRVALKEHALRVIRFAFYESTLEQRLFFSKLARTYTLLFSLQVEPKVVEYFNSMSSEFVLYVGSDIIVGALSEHFLSEPDQMRVNMLKILAEAGATLILSEATLEEVHRHLETSDWEFINHISGIESEVTKEIARHSPKVLIRAYFYNKLNPNPVKVVATWRNLVGQFCTYEKLHRPEGKQELRLYLLAKFRLTYESKIEMRRMVDVDDVDVLAAKLAPIKDGLPLAKNDALQVMAVYGKRESLHEQSKANPYGYRTWWLTHENRIRKFTKDIISARGADYMIRPEFLLNFIALSPSVQEVMQSYRSIFPSVIGVRLSNRLRDDVFHDVIRKLKETKETEPARLQARIAMYSNLLKGDQYKQYEVNFGNS